MRKRLVPRSKLSNRALNRLIEMVVLEVPAVTAAHVIGVYRHRAARVYRVLRQRMARDGKRDAPLRGEVEADESSLSGATARAVWAEARLAQCLSWGLLKRRGKVSTRPVPDVTRATLRAVIRQKVS